MAACSRLAPLRRWHESFTPKLPCLAVPSPNSDPDKPYEYTFSDSNPYLEHIDVAKAAKAARQLLALQNAAETRGDVHSIDTSTPAWWMPERPHEGMLQQQQQQQHHQAAHRPQGEGGFASLVQRLVERAKEEKARALGEVYHPPQQTTQNAHELAAPASEASGPSTLVDAASPTQPTSPTLSEPLAEHSHWLTR